MRKQVAIVHYNTPELTEACILSLRKVGCMWPVTVFDNSDQRPFDVVMPGVTVVDNTKCQLIDFEAELAKYPERSTCYAKVSNYGSVKHMLSVQMLWDILPEGFILLDSDVLLRKPIAHLWDEKFAAVGGVQYFQNIGRKEKDRLIPMLLYMNVPLLKANGTRFFDPERSWWLQKGENNPQNWYDTGATLLEDIRKTKPQLVAKVYPSISDHYLHYGSASWRKTDKNAQVKWLEGYKEYWEPGPSYKLGPVSGERLAVSAKIYVCAHGVFYPQVKNPVYEVVDARTFGDEKNGTFLSEIFTYQKMARKKNLPNVIGFCGYRKYFYWMSNVPTLTEDTKYVSKKQDLFEPMREQYKKFGNPADLELCTEVIDGLAVSDERLAWFAEAWKKALESRYIHPCSMFVMPTKDFKKMMKVVNAILSAWLKKVGGLDGLGKRIEAWRSVGRTTYKRVDRLGNARGEGSGYYNNW